jgi:hypothetical protein
LVLFTLVLASMHKWKLGPTGIVGDAFALGLAGLLVADRARRTPHIRSWLSFGFLILGLLLAGAVVGQALSDTPVLSLGATIADLATLIWLAAGCYIAQRLQPVDEVAKETAQTAFMTAAAFALVLQGVLAVVLFDGYRARGSFENTNYLGHYSGLLTVALAGLGFGGGRRARATIWLGIVVGAVTVVATASFAGLAGLGGAFGYLLLKRRRVSLIPKVAIAVVALLVVFKYGFLSRSSTEALDTQRFDRSGNSRYELWRLGYETWLNHPLGVGLGGVQRTGLTTNELHSDLVALIVERGPIGLVTIVAFARKFKSEALGRPAFGAVAVFVAVEAAFRESLHYRHTWLVLPIVAAIEYAPKVRSVPAGPLQDKGVLVVGRKAPTRALGTDAE